MNRIEAILRKFDTRRLLTIYLIVLLVVPSRLVFAPLAGAGSPQEVLGLLFFGAWIISRTQPHRRHRGRQPVRIVFFVLLISFLASFVLAMIRPMNSLQSSSAVLGLVALFSWAGVLLLCTDLIPSQAVLLTLVRRLAFGGGCLGVLGITQFLTGHLLVDHIWIPGLTPNAAQFSGGITERGGLNRPFGTAVNPIEFGAVLTMILPIAVTLALNDTGRHWARRWFPVATLSFAAFFSISRSALLSGGLALAILGLNWSKQYRKRAIVVLVGFLGVIAMVVPGMLGTFANLFSGIGSDTSAASRTSSYPIVEAFVGRSPILGRGFGSFLPELHILDNAYLGLVIEVGLVGLALFLALLVTGVLSGQKARKVAHTELSRQLGHALSAAIIAGAVGLAFYDGLGFPKGAAMIFLCVGLAAASRRLALSQASLVDPPAGLQPRKAQSATRATLRP